MFIPKQDLTEMIGENKYFHDINETEKFKFNWIATFGHDWWFIHKKMYGFTILYMILSIIANYIFVFSADTMNMSMLNFNFHYPILDWTFRFSWPFLVLYFTFNGFFSNRIYFAFLKSIHKRGIRHVEPTMKSLLIFSLVYVVILALMNFLVKWMFPSLLENYFTVMILSLSIVSLFVTGKIFVKEKALLNWPFVR